jgi:tRNA threonylcarbamoyladenosine modification (KEOPS) complex  Pcc1 subunit
MTIELRDSEAQHFYDALLPEIASVPYKKTRSHLAIKGDLVRIEVTGTDIAALRGTFNSYLNWIKAIDDNLRLSRQ